MNLNNNYKIQTAEKITELSIQNGLIPKQDSVEATARAVCDFFKTIFENLDNINEDSQSH